MAERLLASRKERSENNQNSHSSPILRSRIDHLVQVTPELIVRKRARAADSEGEEEEKAAKQRKMDSLQQQMAKMLEGMDDLKKNVATKEDMRGVNTRLGSIEEEQKSMDSRLVRLERDKANGYRPPTGPRPRPLLDRSESNSAEYRKARRSILISPATASMDGVRSFLLDKMKIPEDVVLDMQVEGIRAIHPKKLPAHRKESTETKKVHLSLRDTYERDLVVSYTSNLETPARLDIVIPEHLQSQRAKLEGIAFKIRRYAKESNEKKIMTSLRLDDKSEDLVMAVRESKNEPWLHYTLQELKQLESKLGKSGPLNEESEQSDDEFV